MRPDLDAIEQYWQAASRGSAASIAALAQRNVEALVAYCRQLEQHIKRIGQAAETDLPDGPQRDAVLLWAREPFDE